MFWLGVHAAWGLATDYNIGMLCFLCVCLLFLFLPKQEISFILMDTIVLLWKGLHVSAVIWLPLHAPAMNQGIDF